MTLDDMVVAFVTACPGSSITEIYEYVSKNGYNVSRARVRTILDSETKYRGGSPPTLDRVPYSRLNTRGFAYYPHGVTE